MIPLATTSITVIGVRPQSPVDPDGAGYGDDVPVQVTLRDGIRAAITQPDALRQRDNRDVVDTYALRCDVFPEGLTHHDIVVDETTSHVYRVTAVKESVVQNFNLDHYAAELRIEKGIDSGGPDDVVPTRQ